MRSAQEQIEPESFSFMSAESARLLWLLLAWGLQMPGTYCCDYLGPDLLSPPPVLRPSASAASVTLCGTNGFCPFIPSFS